MQHRASGYSKDRRFGGILDYTDNCGRQHWNLPMTGAIPAFVSGIVGGTPVERFAEGQQGAGSQSARTSPRTGIGAIISKEMRQPDRMKPALRLFAIGCGLMAAIISDPGNAKVVTFDPPGSAETEPTSIN